MPRKIDYIYKSIAENILNNIDGGWSIAFLEAKIFEDAAEFVGRYKDEEKDGQFKVHHSALDDFEYLQELMKQDGKDKWNRAKFTLKPSGDFSIDFEWDQSLDDEIKSNK